MPQLRSLYDQTMGPPLVELTSHKAGSEVRCGLFLDVNRADVLCDAHPAWAAEPDKLAWSGSCLTDNAERVAAVGASLSARLKDLTLGRVGTVTGPVYPALSTAFAHPGVVRDDVPSDEVDLRKLLAGRTQYMVKRYF